MELNLFFLLFNLGYNYPSNDLKKNKKPNKSTGLKKD